MSNLEFCEGRYVVTPLGRMVRTARLYDKMLDQWSSVEDDFQLALLRQVYVDKFGLKLQGISISGEEIWDINYE
jgi:hypothetical protein